MTQNWKANHFNIVTSLVPERRNSGLSLLLETACTRHGLLGLRRRHSTGVHERSTKFDLRTYMSPWRGWKYKLVTFIAQKPMLLQHNNIMPGPTLLLLLQRWYWTSDWMLFRALLTAKIWHHLPSDWVHLSSIISKECSSHVMKQFKLLGKMI
jgi:hypothetical protein